MSDLGCTVVVLNSLAYYTWLETHKNSTTGRNRSALLQFFATVLSIIPNSAATYWKRIQVLLFLSREPAVVHRDAYCS
ncbi:MAG: hypothetical protein O7B26_02045 [Planctomycetota bacterium]|nr:hypothetical protein [Planctomycetota bacterium]